MADLTVTIAGVRFRNPLIVSSGPLTHDAEAIMRAWDAGASGAVTKTITLRPAANPTPHIAQVDAQGSLLNTEKWSDLPADRWITQEIPSLFEAGGGVIIASVGHTVHDVKELAAPLADAGAHMLEVVSYRGEDMADSVRIAKAECDLPVLAKVSANWADLLDVVEDCLEAGADGITAIDSIGPALAIDVETRRPWLDGPWGFAWLSGTAIKPIALRVVAEIALRWSIPILGVGGISRGRDIIEMMMAGAAAVQVHTAILLNGLPRLGRMLRQLDSWLDAHETPSASDVHRAALPWLRDTEDTRPLVFAFSGDECSDCQRCVVVCAYQARSLEARVMSLNRERCRSCGLCASVCPTSALTIAGKMGDGER